MILAFLSGNNCFLRTFFFSNLAEKNGVQAEHQTGSSGGPQWKPPMNRVNKSPNKTGMVKVFADSKSYLS